MLTLNLRKLILCFVFIAMVCGVGGSDVSADEMPTFIKITSTQKAQVESSRYKLKGEDVFPEVLRKLLVNRLFANLRYRFNLQEFLPEKAQEAAYGAKVDRDRFFGTGLVFVSSCVFLMKW